MKLSKFIAVKAVLVGVGILFTSLSQAYVVEECFGRKNQWPRPADTGHPSPSANVTFNVTSIFGENSTAALEVAKDRWERDRPFCWSC